MKPTKQESFADYLHNSVLLAYKKSKKSSSFSTRLPKLTLKPDVTPELFAQRLSKQFNILEEWESVEIDPKHPFGKKRHSIAEMNAYVERNTPGKKDRTIALKRTSNALKKASEAILDADARQTLQCIWSQKAHILYSCLGHLFAAHDKDFNFVKMGGDVCTVARLLDTLREDIDIFLADSKMSRGKLPGKASCHPYTELVIIKIVAVIRSSTNIKLSYSDKSSTFIFVWSVITLLSEYCLENAIPLDVTASDYAISFYLKKAIKDPHYAPRWANYSEKVN